MTDTNNSILDHTEQLLPALRAQGWPDFLIESMLDASKKTSALRERLTGDSGLDNLLYLLFRTRNLGEDGFTSQLVDPAGEGRPGDSFDFYGVNYLTIEAASRNGMIPEKGIGLELDPDLDTGMDGLAWARLPKAGGNHDRITNHYVMWLFWACSLKLFTDAEVTVSVNPDRQVFMAHAVIDDMFVQIYHSHKAVVRSMDRTKLIETMQAAAPTTKSIN